MSALKDERIKKAVAATNAPDQVVRRPVPALGLFIHAAAQNANLATNVATAEPPKDLVQTFSKDENVIAADSKFPVARHSAKVTPDKKPKINLITPVDYSGPLEKKLNLETPKPPLNPWSSEAYSIFEGNLLKFIKVCMSFFQLLLLLRGIT